MNRNGLYKYGNVGVMGAGPGSERWMNVPYIENNAIVLDIPPPNDSVSRAAVRPQPLAVTQGEPIPEDEEHEEDPWKGRGCTTERLTMTEPNSMFAVRILR